jgi:hypothetical protein
MRKRLRPMPSPAELDRLYRTPHDHRNWVDHLVRVDVTVSIVQNMMPPRGVITDLSCGNAEIARRIAAITGAAVVLGDYAPGYQHTGPIEETIHQVEHSDMFILSETLEHLDDPDLVLRAIRPKTDRLVLSTPDGETNDQNPEHVWGWDAEEVEKMLRAAGFIPDIHTTLDLRPMGFLYSYQIWVCR